MNFKTTAAIAVVAALAAIAMPASAQLNRAIDSVQEAAKAVMENADETFMRNAASGGMAQVDMGRIALQKSTDPEIKKHAQHMIDDHTKANDELKTIAANKKVTLPTEPEAKQRETIRKLNGLSGKEFDAAFVQDAGIDAHTEMRTLFQDEISNGKDADLKAFASKILPVINAHLAHFEKIAPQYK